MSVRDRQFLIVGGQSKAGTTSVFKWLADHPETVPSKVNEARFFLDPGYPLPSGRRYDGTNLEEYAACFPRGQENRVHVESSPDYLYSRSALRIANLLPHARIVFILRDPVERAVSWYRFAAQLGHLPRDMTFEDYIRAQVGVEVTQVTPAHMRLLEQNRIEKYLPPFREAFGDRCLELDFADLKRDPSAVMQRIASFGGIDPAFYEGRKLEAQNVTSDVHAARTARIYYRVRAWLVYRLGFSRKVTRLLQPLSRTAKSLLSGSAAAKPVTVSDDMKILLESEALLPTSAPESKSHESPANSEEK